MTTSSSTDLEFNANELIFSAFEAINQVDLNTLILSPHQLNRGMRALNLFLNRLQVRDTPLWSVEWTQKTLTASDEVTGTDGNIYTCIRSHISSSSNKPVTGANWTTYWVLGGETGGAWADSTSYSSVGDFTPDSDTIGIVDAFVRQSDGTDDQMKVIGMREWRNIWNKTDENSPFYLIFENKLSPIIYIQPIPDDTTDVIHYQRIRKLEDFDNLWNTPDAPARFADVIYWNLAYRLSFGTTGIQEEEKRRLRDESVRAMRDFRVDNTEQDENRVMKGCY